MPAKRTACTFGCARKRSASSAAVSVCRAMRTSSVFRPRSSSHAGSGAATMPVRVRNARSSSTSRPTTAPSSASWWPPRYFVTLCSAKSAPRSSGRRWTGVRRRVDDDGRGRGRGLEVRHRLERVRRSLEPDELHAFRRRAGLVELDVLEAPLAECLERDAGAEVAALGERDRVPRLQERQDQCGCRAGAGREEQGLAAVELPEPRLRLRDGGAAVP